MKVYLDTTIITILLFEQTLQSARYGEVKQLFAQLDAGRLQAVVSLYALQELCAYCYSNFPAEQAPRVTRLACHELLSHELLLFPLLSRMDRIVLNRRFPMSDTSDQAHTATAYHAGCTAIITYDHHYQEVAGQIAVLTAGEVVARLA